MPPRKAGTMDFVGIAAFSSIMFIVGNLFNVAMISLLYLILKELRTLNAVR